MAKNKLTKSALAAALVTSAIVPVAAVSAAETGEVTSVIFTIDGVNYELSYADYNEAIGDGLLNPTDVDFVVVNGNTFSMDTYNQAVSDEGSVQGALDYLAENTDDAEDVETVEGEVGEDGIVVPDPSVLDTTTLDSAKVEAGKLVKAEYTAESWTALQTALGFTVTEETTQEQVDAAVAAINKAIAELVKAPVALAVESVSAINQNLIEVTFNKEVDKSSAITKTNYKIDGAALPAADYIVFGEDKKSVKIYKAANLNQDQKVSVAVSGVLEANTYKKVADYNTEVTVRDAANPLLTKAELKNGNKELYLTFNETLRATNVTSLDSYTINGQALSTFGATVVAFDQAAAADNSTGAVANKTNVVKVTFASSLPAGTHTVAVKADKLQDPAGFYAVNQSAQFTALADTTALAVVETKATAGTAGTVEVKFNKELGTLLSTYAVNNSGAILIPTLKSGTKDTIVLTSNIDEGANIVVIPGAQKDAFGNKIGENDLRISVNGVKDTVKPTVETVYALTDKKVRVKFSENVNIAPFVTAKANYTIKDAAGTVVYSSTVDTANYTVTSNVDGDNKLVDIAFATALPGSNYTIEIKGVQDGAGNEVVTYTGSFVSPDKTNPTLATSGNKAVASTTNKTVEVFFSEPMDAATITNKANYLYKTTGAFEALPTSATVEASADNKSVKITFPSTVSVATIADINVLNVKDTAGNLIDAGSQQTGTPSTTLGVAPKVVAGSAVATADSEKVTVTFETDQQITAIDKADFANFLTGTPVTGTITGAAPDNATVTGKTITLTYNSSNADFARIKSAGKTLALASNFIANAGTDTKNAYGDVLTTTGVTADNLKVKDQIKPEIVTPVIDSIGAKSITLEFNEKISDGNLAEIKDDVLITTGGAYTTVDSVSVTNEKVTFNTKDALQGKVTLNLVADKISIKDEAGNVFAPKTADLERQDTTASTVTVNTAAELTAAVANTDVTAITLGANITANVAATRAVNINLGGFTLTGNVSYTTASTTANTLSNGTVTGTLTVDTPNADFTNSATVQGTTTIINVKPTTFTNTGTLAQVEITDADGITFAGNGSITGLTLNTTGAVTLNSTITVPVVVTQPATVTIPTGNTISSLVVQTAGNVTLAGAGTISTVAVQTAGATVTAAPTSVITSVEVQKGATGVTLTVPVASNVKAAETVTATTVTATGVTVPLTVTPDTTAPTVTITSVNTTTTGILNGTTIDLRTATANSTLPVTTAAGTITEDAKVVIKLASDATAADKAKYEQTVNVTTAIDFAQLLTLATAADTSIEAATLAKFDGATITLSDVVGNTTTYTLDTK